METPSLQYPATWLTYRQFLAHSPKKNLALLYKEKTSKEGLVRGTELVEELCSLWEDQPPSPSNYTDQEKLLIGNIYMSGSLGLTEASLSGLLHDKNPQEMQELLRRLEKDQLIYTRKGESFVFYGFRDLWTLWCPPWLTLPGNKQAKADKITLVSHKDFFIRHFINFLNRCCKGQIRVTKQGQIQRRTLLYFQEKCTYSEQIFPDSGAEELLLYIRLAQQAGLIVASDDLYKTTPQFELLYAQNSQQLFNRLLEIWVYNASPERVPFLLWLQQNPGLFVPLNEWKNILYAFVESSYSNKPSSGNFSPSSPDWLKNSSPNSPYTSWDDLPSLLRELWHTGLIDFTIHQRKITGFQVQAHIPDPPLLQKFTADYTLYLSPNAPLTSLLLAEGCGIPLGDEVITQYRLTKESLLSGLNNKIQPDLLQKWLESIGTSTSTLQTVSEWIHSYTRTHLYAQVTLLEIRDPALYHELDNWEAFKKCVAHSFPHSAFAIPTPNIPQIKELLASLHIHPGYTDTRIELPVEPISPPEIPAVLSSPAKLGEITLFAQEGVRVLPGRVRSSESTQAPPPSDLEKKRLVEYSLLTEKMLEVQLIQKKEETLWIRPIHLLQSGASPKIIGTDVKNGQRCEVFLNQISSLKVIE